MPAWSLDWNFKNPLKSNVNYGKLELWKLPRLWNLWDLKLWDLSCYSVTWFLFFFSIYFLEYFHEFYKSIYSFIQAVKHVKSIKMYKDILLDKWKLNRRVTRRHPCLMLFVGTFTEVLQIKKIYSKILWWAVLGLHLLWYSWMSHNLINAHRRFCITLQLVRLHQNLQEYDRSIPEKGID